MGFEKVSREQVPPVVVLLEEIDRAAPLCKVAGVLNPAAATASKVLPVLRAYIADQDARIASLEKVVSELVQRANE